MSCECRDVYYCPTGGEVECPRHGGFDVCCARPDLHYVPRVWTYRPEWHWFGWRTLLPVSIGGDEWNRWTLCLGWTITGRVIIALWE